MQPNQTYDPALLSRKIRDLDIEIAALELWRDDVMDLVDRLDDRLIQAKGRRTAFFYIQRKDTSRESWGRGLRDEVRLQLAILDALEELIDLMRNVERDIHLGR